MDAKSDWETCGLIDKAPAAASSTAPVINPTAEAELFDRSVPGSIINWPYISAAGQVEWFQVAASSKPAAILISSIPGESSQSTDHVHPFYCVCAYILCRFRILLYRKIERLPDPRANIPEPFAAALSTLDELGHWLHVHKPTEDWQTAFVEAESPAAWKPWLDYVSQVRSSCEHIRPSITDIGKWVDMRNPNAPKNGTGFGNVVTSGMTLEEYNASIDARNLARAELESQNLANAANHTTGDEHAAKPKSSRRTRTKAAKHEPDSSPLFETDDSLAIPTIPTGGYIYS